MLLRYEFGAAFCQILSVYVPQQGLRVFAKLLQFTGSVAVQFQKDFRSLGVGLI